MWRTAVRLMCAGGLLVAAVSVTACSGDRQLAEDVASMRRELADTRAEVTRLQDVNAIEKLTRAYGYYIDKGMWTDVADLFADDGSVQLGGSGIFRGKAGVTRMFVHGFGGGIGRGSGVNGLPFGRLFNHPQFQGIVDVDPGGTTAKGRWRTLAQAAWRGERAFWNEGVYENAYVKQNGVWKFASMKFWPTYFTDYDKSWAVQDMSPIGQRANSPHADYPPDAPSPVADQDSMYPGYFLPPYHYANPVTGKASVAPASIPSGNPRQ